MSQETTFIPIRQIPIPSLNITVEEYRHVNTAARHLHMAAHDNNNAFLIAFLTVPEDSTGVAHILEHTSLCGSQHYPVRDPFFMMTRRSLNTFMNAFTSSDWTAYPFASQNTKDFENLLRIYLDAVFFPRLDPLDFAQEGHRLEFKVADDPTTPLMYKGVVFNEMKGAMSAPINTLWHALHEQLFPTITYHYNSGGDPKEIPQLTYEQLKAFHASHYHPANAILMTYGDRAAHHHQRLFEACALRHFQPLDLKLAIADEQRYSAPKKVVRPYAIEETESTEHKTHIVCAWLLSHSTDVQAMMEAHVLTGVLLDNSASPLRRALETSSLGSAPSPLCGLDDSTREASFFCGLEGSDPEHADAVEQLILQVLEQVVREGVPQEHIESVLHQIELNQREISGDHFPYGLHLLINALSPMIHGGDPVAFLDIDPTLTVLRQECQDSQFIPRLIQKHLLDNPHRVRLVMLPDTQLATQQLQAETEALAAIKARLSASEQAQLVAQAAALEARQQQQDDAELLPKVGLDDIPLALQIPEWIEQPIAQLPATWFVRATNGMIYQSIVIELPAMATELIELLALFCDCLTEVGCGGDDYLATASRQAAVSGGIHARISLRGSVNDVHQYRGLFSLSGKALKRNQAALTALLRDTLESARFDEFSRLRELIAQLRTESDNHITSRGHHLAMGACLSGINAAGALYHRWHGFAALHHLRTLDDRCRQDPEAIVAFAEQLTHIKNSLLTAPKQFLVIGEAEQHQSLMSDLTACWRTSQPPSPQEMPLQLPFSQQHIRQAWLTNTQVNFCAQAYPTVAVEHPHAPTLVVLGDFLRHGYLHRALREQGGAYGGGAHYDSDTGAFRFYSYRDPRLADTLTDFERALQWLHHHHHEPQALEEAILSVIARIDRPGSPAGEAINTFFSNLHGRTPIQRRTFRQQILQVTLADLQQVAAEYLQAERAHVAVLTEQQCLAQAAELNLETQWI